MRGRGDAGGDDDEEPEGDHADDGGLLINLVCMALCPRVRSVVATISRSTVVCLHRSCLSVGRVLCQVIRRRPMVARTRSTWSGSGGFQDSGCKVISGNASGRSRRLAARFRRAPVHRVLDGVSEVVDQGMRDVFAKLEARTPRSSKWWARVSKSKIQRRNKFSWWTWP